MKLACILIGNNLALNFSFFNYILKNIEDEIAFPNSIKIMKKNDKDILFTIEDFSKTHDYILIFTQDDSYALISKVLSTLTDDRLELKDGLLIPSLSHKHEKNSYLTKLNLSFINVLKVEEGEKLPNILTQSFTKNSLKVNIISSRLPLLKKEIIPFSKSHDLDITISSLSHNYQCLHIGYKKHTNKKKIIESLKNRFPNAVIFEGDIIEFIIKKLKEKKQTISFAESCTGGLLSYMFVQKQDVSRVFDGSLITYSYGFKEDILGVNKKTLESNGSVSSECIKEMLAGLFDKTGCDFAIAISGIAGPSGATDTKPLGSVYIGIQKRDSFAQIDKFTLKGDRTYIQSQSVISAISSLILYERDFFQ